MDWLQILNFAAPAAGIAAAASVVVAIINRVVPQRVPKEDLGQKITELIQKERDATNEKFTEYRKQTAADLADLNEKLGSHQERFARLVAYTWRLYHHIQRNDPPPPPDWPDGIFGDED